MKTAEGEISFAVLGKLVRAMLSVFTGPLVEDSFNIMDVIVDKHKVKLSIETYEGFAVIVTPESSRGDCQCSIKEILSFYGRYKSYLMKKKDKMCQEKEQKIREAVRVLIAVKVRAFSTSSTSTGAKQSSSTA